MRCSSSFLLCSSSSVVWHPSGVPVLELVMEAKDLNTHNTMRGISQCCALLCSLLLLARAEQEQVQQQRPGHEVAGSVVLPPTSDAVVVKLYTADGQELQAFPGMDGAFAFQDVPPGSHMLQPFCIRYYFPEVRLDVSAKSGLSRAAIVASSQKIVPVPLPLSLRPLNEMQYYEKRKPVDFWSLLKSPYGLMIVGSLFVIFVMPKMKVDPEEYKEFTQQIKGGGQGSSSGVQQKQIAGR